MDNDKKIEKWIRDMEAEGKTRDDIAKGVFVSKQEDGTFNVYRLSKSGKKNYNLNIHIGAVDLEGIQ